MTTTITPAYTKNLTDPIDGLFTAVDGSGTIHGRPKVQEPSVAVERRRPKRQQATKSPELLEARS